MAELVKASDLAGLLGDIKDLIPIVLPTVVGFLGFRKAWAFLKSQIKSA